MTIRMLMLGDCTIATSYLPPVYKNEYVLAAKLRERYPDDTYAIVNEGLDGESIGKFLKRYERMMRRYHPPDYVLIRYGVNDRREYGVDGFRAALSELCERLRADLPRARILLETGVYVDYPAHYEFDRNVILQPIYEVIRELARHYAMPLVDVYERMKRETEQGNWDLRVRGYGIVDEDIPVFGAGQDHLHVGDVRWWTNIHPNPHGIAVIADEEAQVLKRHWPDTLRF